MGEQCLADAVHPYKGGISFQFERVGFFVADYTSTRESPVFNLTVPLTDTWAARTDDSSKEAQVYVERVHTAQVLCLSFWGRDNLAVLNKLVDS